jgi:hypothetical protein
MVAASVLLSSARVIDAQVGVSVCACQPDLYEFTLDFSLTCNDTDIIKDMPGINVTACRVSPVASQDLTDSVPVVVTSVQILELGPPPTYMPLFSTTIPLQLSDGGKFNYMSITTNPQDITPDKVPSGLQLTITGSNQKEEEVLNYWLIVYDNDCGIWPLLEEGQKIGWTVFSGLSNPSPLLCSASPCQEVDGVCSDVAQCCAPANVCAGPAGGPKTCQVLRCRNLGQRCSSAAQCCSPSNKVCERLAGGPKTCQVCKAVGSKCSRSTQCCAPGNKVCDGSVGGPRTCKLCRGIGKTCSRSTECCSPYNKVCESRRGNPKLCKICRERGAPCARHSQCCGGLKCRNRRCRS